MVTAVFSDVELRQRAWDTAAKVVDPEIPVLTIADLGVLRDVAVTDGLVDISAHGEHGNHSYLMKYVRVYQRRNGHWQMLMQHSVGETSPIAFDIPSSK